MVMADALVEVHLRLPAQERAGAGDVGLAHLRVIDGQRLELQMRGFVPVMRMISSPNSLMVISRGLPMLTGSWKSLWLRR